MGTVNTIESGTKTVTITLNADTATVSVGAKGDGGELILFDSEGAFKIGLNSKNGTMVIRDAPQGSALFGKARLTLSGESASIHLKDATGENTISLDGSSGNLALAGAGGPNTISLQGATAHIELGGQNTSGQIFIRNGAGLATVVLNGETGDIVLANADCAEDFEIAARMDPGTVVVLNEDGRLQESSEQYDKKVAGVISGAGDYKPGIILGRQSCREGSMPLALVGRAYCKVDAQYAPIEVGDLLTTSSTAGHAMKAHEPQRAFGAVLGKALRSLQRGQDLIPILITLQ